MDPRATRGAGWIAFSTAVLIIGGAFAIIDGLMAVYRSRFFSSSAVYVFSDLKTWGWIVFGLGVAAVAAGFAVFTGAAWARWLGVAVAALNAIAQLMFAQAYPLLVADDHVGRPAGHLRPDGVRRSGRRDRRVPDRRRPAASARTRSGAASRRPTGARRSRARPEVAGDSPFQQVRRRHGGVRLQAVPRRRAGLGTRLQRLGASLKQGWEFVRELGVVRA